jgi:hypothetical protein
MTALDALARFLLSNLTIGASVTLVVIAKPAIADPLPPAMQAVLDAHNAYRAKHCVPALTWSTELAASAQRWANRCQFDRDDQNPHGENLFWGTPDAFSPRSAATDCMRRSRSTPSSNPMATRPATSRRWSGEAPSSLAAAWPYAVAATFGSAAIRRLAMSAASLLTTFRSLAADATASGGS